MSGLQIILRLIGLGVIGLLALFAVRRFVFLLTLTRPQPPLPKTGLLPTVLLLVPARNEAASLPQLFATLDKLEYPRDRLRVVLIDDGSSDATGDLMRAAAHALPNWDTLQLERNVGKAEALNHALAAHDFGEIIFVFDADHRPWSDCVRTAVAAFSDPEVAGVNGRMLIGNWYASPTAFYTKVESLVHQLVTVRGKDVLQLGPPLLGSNSGYRRSALAALGGFTRGAFLEDTDFTLRLHRAGFKTRFVPAAISIHNAPVNIKSYAQQHARWGRGFQDAARTNLLALLGDARLSIPMRIELALFSLGYLDRLAFLGAVVLIALDLYLGIEQWRLLGIAIVVSYMLPFAQIVGAFRYDRVPRGMWLRLPLVGLFFVIDVFVAVGATLGSLFARPRVWQPTERSGV